MKLNTKRTVCVGFAFFLICAFWQAYDTIIPKILTDRFGMSQGVSGFIMALDNIFALFLLPLFGVLSDKCRSKLGRRTPFILGGTLLAVAALVVLSWVSGVQLDRLGVIGDIDRPEARYLIYDAKGDESLVTPDGERFVLSERFTRDEFAAIPSERADGSGKADDDYTAYVVPARQAYVRTEITAKNIEVLVGFIAILLLLLLSMATFRTPAVALMPDVTPKPLRSKGNAIINLTGTVGGSLILGLGMLLGTGSTANTFMSYSGYFLIVGGLMLVCLAAFMITVNEPKMVREMEEESRAFGIDESADDSAEDSRGGDPARSGSDSVGSRLSRGELLSLVLILASVVLWYFGYNAVTSKYSVYAGNVLGLDYNSTLLVANVAALISFIPVGALSSRFGRKKMIIAGVILLGAAFTVAAFLTNGTPLPVMMVIFSLAGIGWATINVNSFPMVVELARGGNVGRYTGFYYTASMAAQTLTPVLSGFMMDKLGMRTLFPYAAVCVAAALVTMSFVKHGDSKPQKKGALESLGDGDEI